MKCKLADVCTKIGSGATPRGGKEAYCDKGISLVRSQNILDFTFSNDGLVFINDEQAAKLNNVEVFDEDVLLNITGDSVARACMMNSAFLPARVNQHVAIIRGKKDCVLNRYLLYFLQWEKEYLLQLASAGATRNALTKGMIEQLEIDLPSIDEQKKIVALLCGLDDKIELNKKSNENLLAQADLLYDHIFSDEKNFTELGNVIETTSGGTPSRKHPELYENSSIFWVKSKELNGGFIHNTEEMINEIALSKSSAKMLPVHCVLVAMYGATVGEYGIIALPMTCNQAICALIPNDRYPYPYLYELIRHSKEKLKNMAVGSAQQNISQVLIKQLPVHANIDKVEQFSDATIASFQMIETLTLENIRLAFMRDTLLPKLMSNELDVSDIQL